MEEEEGNWLCCRDVFVCHNSYSLSCLIDFNGARTKQKTM